MQMRQLLPPLVVQFFLPWQCSQVTSFLAILDLLLVLENLRRAEGPSAARVPVRALQNTDRSAV
jgi:hypothetical protein